MGVVIKKSSQSNFVIFCDFCGESEKDCDVIIASPNGAHICGACAELCVEVAKEHAKKGSEP